jgi:hypothetical protein
MIKMEFKQEICWNTTNTILIRIYVERVLRLTRMVLNDQQTALTSRDVAQKRQGKFPANIGMRQNFPAIAPNLVGALEHWFSMG